MLLGILL